MQDKKFKFWQKWLTYANVMTIVVGILVAFYKFGGVSVDWIAVGHDEKGILLKMQNNGELRCNNNWRRFVWYWSSFSCSR